MNPEIGISNLMVAHDLALNQMVEHQIKTLDVVANLTV